jgi:hypothetical protein
MKSPFLFFLLCIELILKITTADDKTVIIENLYKDLINPVNTNLKPIKVDIPFNLKPEYLLQSNEETKTQIIESTKITLEDYQYSGALGLGSGVIAIIAFMIVGLLICIYGNSTEYSLLVIL